MSSANKPTGRNQAHEMRASKAGTDATRVGEQGEIEVAELVDGGIDEPNDRAATGTGVGDDGTAESSDERVEEAGASGLAEASDEEAARMSDDGKAALNVADGAVATERAGSSQGSNAAVGVFDGDDGVCRDADEDIAGGEGSSAVEGMVQFDPVEDASENQPSVSAMLDPAVLSMGGDGLQEGASRLLPPLNVDPLQAEDVVVIVGEPGLRKTAVARRLARGGSHADGTAYAVFARGRMDELQASLSSTVGRVKRAAKRAKGRTQVLLIDDFPAASEDELGELVISLRSASIGGAAVVITMLPEAYQLAEELPEARIVKTGDLLYRLPYVEDPCVRAAWARTHGIPVLVDALRQGGDPAGTRYTTALRQLVLSSLRGGLPTEERQIRLAMVLLGTGSFADLSLCAERVDKETLAYLADEAPFFGIEPIASEFDCAGVNDTERLRDCYMVVRSIDVLGDEMLTRVCSVLMGRGDYERAAICCQLISSDERRCKCVLRWGVEFCLAGALQLVKDTLVLARKLYMSGEVGYESACLALRAIDEKAGTLPSVAAVKGVSSRTEERKRAILQLLIASRRLDIGFKAMVKTVQATGETAAPLFEHLKAANALFEGRPTEAARFISAGAPVSWPATVPEALLVYDLRVATALVGERLPGYADPVYERARRTMEGSHSMRLAAYQRALPDILSVIAGGQSGNALDQAISRAGIEGDAALQTAFSIFKCVDELRRGDWLAVSVRANRAIDVARGTTCPYLRQTCELFRAVARLLMGDDSYLVEMATKPDKGQSVPRDLARLIVGTCRGEQLFRRAKNPRSAEVSQQSLKLTMLSRSSLSRDALWLVQVLANDCGELSTLLRLQLPASWKHALNRANFGAEGTDVQDNPRSRKAAAKEAGPRAESGEMEALRAGSAVSVDPTGSSQATDVRAAAARADELLGTSAVLQRHTVYLSMLGGFTAMLDGRTVSQERLRSRRCGEVLALLCVAPKHAMRRVQLVEILWPTLDFRSGNQRLYEALSVGRKALGSGRYSGYDPFVVSKGKGMVALNPDCVTCDIDLFQRAASEATKKEGIHEMVVEQASAARTLYGGDLDSAILHDIDEALQLKEHLRYVFATAMVAGARAAMATERQQLAVQFAQDACVACRTREDAAAALMEALCLANRSLEAREAYEQFCSRLISLTGMPPSRGLRDLAARLFPSDTPE